MASKPISSQCSRARRMAFLEVYHFEIGKCCREWFHFLQGPETAALRAKGVHLAGTSLLHPPYINSRPYSNFDALLFILEGKMKLTLPSRTTHLQAGEVWAVPSNSLCRYELPAGSARMSWMHLNPGSFPIHLTQGESSRIILDDLLCKRMHLLLETLQEKGMRTEIQSRRICQKVYEWMDLELESLLSAGAEDPNATAVLRIHQLWAEVESNMGHPWDIPSMAGRAELSPSQFRALCLKHFGVNPHEKLSRIRMNRAMGLLLSTPNKVEAIAREVGYASLEAFCKIFKKSLGMSPTEFREKRGGNSE